MPVPSTYVSSMIRRNTAAVDDDTEDDKAEYGCNFDEAKNKFDFSIAPDAEELDKDEER